MNKLLILIPILALAQRSPQPVEDWRLVMAKQIVPTFVLSPSNFRCEIVGSDPCRDVSWDEPDPIYGGVTMVSWQNIQLTSPPQIVRYN